VVSGQVSVAVPRGARYHVDASVGSGDVLVDPALDSSTAPGTITASVTRGEVEVGYR
jgi:hypothetical protein